MPLLQIIFIVCRQKDASSFHLVSHFEDCSHSVTLTCELIYVLRILWNISYCWLELAIMGSAIMWEAVACFHQSSSHLSYELGVLFNYSCFYWLVRGCTHKSLFFFSFHLKRAIWLFHSQHFWNIGHSQHMEA
jgi:hypothetical protein